MTHEEFAEILAQQLERISATLGVKQDEYGTDDYLHNIRQAALLQKESLPEAVVGMMAKHTVSIFEMVKSGKPFPEEKWDEKITDHLVWLILLKAALIEGAKNPLDANATDVLQAHMDQNRGVFVDVSEVLVTGEGYRIPASEILRYAAHILEKNSTP